MGPCRDMHTPAGQAGHVAGTLPGLCIIHGAGKPQALSVWGQLLLQTPRTSSKMPSSPALGGAMEPGWQPPSSPSPAQSSARPIGAAGGTSHQAQGGQ